MFRLVLSMLADLMLSYILCSISLCWHLFVNVYLFRSFGREIYVVPHFSEIGGSLVVVTTSCLFVRAQPKRSMLRKLGEGKLQVSGFGLAEQ